MSKTQHIFIVGSKGIPGNYGGYETFVDRLTESHEGNHRIRYHVACKAREDGEFEYHGARCFNVKVPDVGPAQAIWYDVAALGSVCRYVEETTSSTRLFTSWRAASVPSAPTSRSVSTL